MELGEHLVVERHLVAADGAPVGRIEGQDDGSAPQVVQADFLIGGGAQLEIGGRGPGPEDAVSMWSDLLAGILIHVWPPDLPNFRQHRGRKR